MQIEIVKCLDSNSWYFNKVGEIIDATIEVVHGINFYYNVKIGDKLRSVHLCDARIINRRDKIEKLLNRNSCK